MKDRKQWIWRIGIPLFFASLMLSGPVTGATSVQTSLPASSSSQSGQTAAAASPGKTEKMGLWQRLLQHLANSRVVPDDYTKTVKTGGDIERTYLAVGPDAVAHEVIEAPKPMKNYEIYYPAALTETKQVYPAVVMVNGSGTPATRYPAMFEHLASWGFIVIGNEDPGTGTGESADKTTEKLLALNRNPASPFYGRIAEDRIGISGHSQGGAGVFNAITSQPHHGAYRTAVALSPTNEQLAKSVYWDYNPQAVQVPILMLAGTKGDFEMKLVLPEKEMKSLYDRIPSPKVMARRKGAEHGQTLYECDGYVTAWLRWQLMGDEYAGKAFTGPSPELAHNRWYEEVKKRLP